MYFKIIFYLYNKKLLSLSNTDNCEHEAMRYGCYGVYVLSGLFMREIQFTFSDKDTVCTRAYNIL